MVAMKSTISLEYSAEGRIVSKTGNSCTGLIESRKALRYADIVFYRVSKPEGTKIKKDTPALEPARTDAHANPGAGRCSSVSAAPLHTCENNGRKHGKGNYGVKVSCAEYLAHSVCYAIGGLVVTSHPLHMKPPRFFDYSVLTFSIKYATSLIVPEIMEVICIPVN